MSVSGWAGFWQGACAVGFVAFYALVAIVVPLGARDLVRLFRHLSRTNSEREGDEP
jgi:hypothetical protein